jgi:hypothetical protein
MTGYGIDSPKIEVGFREGTKICLLFTAFTPGLIQLPVQRRPKAVSPEMKRLRHKAGHLPSSSPYIENAWSYTSISPYSFMA